MVELLADYCVFEGRRVVIEIVNGVEIRWSYDPPLSSEILPIVALAERRLNEPPLASDGMLAERQLYDKLQ